MKQHYYLKGILLFLCLFIGTKAYAYDAKIDGIYYNFSGDEATVTYATTSYNSYSGAVVIPETVTYNGRTYSVTTIDSYAFYNCSGLTSITIPTTLKMIKTNAFNGCTSLVKVIVKDIAAWCGILYDGGSAFANVNIPLFYAQHLYSDENTEITEVIIPEGVTRIEARTFRDAKFITSVNIPSSVTYIGVEAFRGMHSLTSINIPQTMTSIEPYTFQDCRSLSSISVPNGVTSIGYHAFRECLSLTTITIPKSLTTIGESAFKDCPCLNDLYCYAENVPSTNSTVFNSTPISSATLHVPAGSVESYRTTSPWNNFGLIVAIGEDVNPETIEIATAEDLKNFANRVNAGETSLCAVLTADIDLYGVEWTPIGNNNTKYAGIFEGQGHIITGFNYTATSDYNGLFGYINNATIKDFSISGILTSTYNHNGVVGNADGASIVSGIHSSLTINVSNCYAHTGGVVGGTSGRGHTLFVENCEYSGTLTHSGEGDCQAGILGYTYHGGVRNCFFSGTIIGENSMYGGILAYCKEPSFSGIQNCLSIGKIIAEEECTTAAAIIANWNGGVTANVKNNYYCLQEESTTTIAIGNNTQNCEAPIQVTAEQLANGEVCYALNGDQTEINWYQTLGEDVSPVPDNRHKQVWYIEDFYTNRIIYSITFDTNGGNQIESITQRYGTTITPPENPTKEGHTFIGWEPAIPETMPATDLTITAQWQINSYTLVYMVDGEEYKTSTVAYGTALTPETAPTKEGHTFSGWNGLPKTMPAHDVTVTGSFSVNNYTITYMVDGVVYMTSTVAYGTELVPEPALQKDGYTFTGWSEIPKTMPAHDVVVTGAFYIYGDVNTDDEVDLLDVVDIARFVVVTPAETFMVNLADLNYDKTVNVTDAVVLVNVVAGDQNFVKEMKMNTTSGYYDYASCGLELSGGRDNMLSIYLNGEVDFTAFQFTVDVPEDMNITDLHLNGMRKDGHQLLYNKVEDGTYRVVALSLTNSVFKGSEGELLSISFDGLTPDEICIHDIHFVTTKGTEVTFDDLYLSGTATGIENLMSRNGTDDKVYDLQGRRQPALRHGVNIVGGRKIIKE